MSGLFSPQKNFFVWFSKTLHIAFLSFVVYHSITKEQWYLFTILFYLFFIEHWNLYFLGEYYLNLPNSNPQKWTWTVALFPIYRPLRALYNTRHIHTHSKTDADPLIRSSLGFNILLKDTSACSRGIQGCESATVWVLDDPLYLQKSTRIKAQDVKLS